MELEVFLEKIDEILTSLSLFWKKITKTFKGAKGLFLHEVIVADGLLTVGGTVLGGLGSGAILAHANSILADTIATSIGGGGGGSGGGIGEGDKFGDGGGFFFGIGEYNGGHLLIERELVNVNFA